MGAHLEALDEGVLLVPLDSRYTQVGFNFASVQVCLSSLVYKFALHSIGFSRISFVRRLGFRRPQGLQNKRCGPKRSLMHHHAIKIAMHSGLGSRKISGLCQRLLYNVMKAQVLSMCLLTISLAKR